MSIETRINAKGYREFRDPHTGEWVPTHRRAAEKRFGALRSDQHVHHIDGDKLNNRPENLAVVHAKVHGRLHVNPDVCYCCGREGHHAAECYATTFYDGTPLRT